MMGRMEQPTAIPELLATTDEDRRHELLVAFVAADPPGAFSVAERLIGAPDAEQRRLGADMFGQVTQLDPPLAARIADLLIPRVGVETDPDVLQAAIAALGHARDERARGPVMACANNADVDVRLAVAWAIPSLGLDRQAVDVLTQLSRDADDDVRDWATFGLAQSELFGLAPSDAVSADILEALFARTADPHYDTRCEAILGLAMRHDPRARIFVDRELAQPMVGSLIEEARDLLDAV